MNYDNDNDGEGSSDLMPFIQLLAYLSKPLIQSIYHPSNIYFKYEMILLKYQSSITLHPSPLPRPLPPLTTGPWPLSPSMGFLSMGPWGPSPKVSGVVMLA